MEMLDSTSIPKITSADEKPSNKLQKATGQPIANHHSNEYVTLRKPIDADQTMHELV